MPRRNTRTTQARRTTRIARLEARITREALAVVRRAAQIQGRSVSDFVVAAAQQAAQKIVAEVEVMRLSREAQEQFVKLLLSPSQADAGIEPLSGDHDRSQICQR